jgi:tRNA(Ile)-lysidine synthase
MKSTLVVRQAVKPWLEKASARILIGVSGGADSLALAVASHLEASHHSVEVVALVIDHGLQDGSDKVAKGVAESLEKIGIDNVEIVRIHVEMVDGLEASARRARYAAFEAAIAKYSPDYFFLAHTKNDQAENVLLGLARGSGTRSLSGMADENGIFIRPILHVDRSTTEEVCRENNVTPWVDPQNSDETYARVRARKNVLPILDNNLGPGIIDALARSARILREDADALDEYAEDFLKMTGSKDLDVELLDRLPKAVRSRVLRRVILAAGAPSGSITADHVAAVEALVTAWHGQGEVSLPGGVKVGRISGRLSLSQG